MIMEAINEQEMFVLTAPDGAPQISTLAPSFIFCVAQCEMLAAFGVAKPLASLFKEGFKILPVKVTMKQNGSADDAFKSTR